MDDHQTKMHMIRVQMQEKIKINNYNTAPSASNTTAYTNNKNDEDPNSIFLREKIPTPFSDSRKKLILEFFIRHFISMARKSNEFRNYGQVHNLNNTNC